MSVSVAQTQCKSDTHTLSLSLTHFLPCAVCFCNVFRRRVKWHVSRCLSVSLPSPSHSHPLTLILTLTHTHTFSLSLSLTLSLSHTHSHLHRPASLQPLRSSSTSRCSAQAVPCHCEVQYFGADLKGFFNIRCSKLQSFDGIMLMVGE